MKGFTRNNRIGIDIDTKNRFELLKKYFNSLRFGKCVVFETLHGYHIHILVPNRTSDMNMIVRHIIGDCQNRLDLDEARLRFGLDDIIETLFHYKKIGKDISIETEIDPLSEPWWSGEKENGI